jgi:hypothetical protein
MTETVFKASGSPFLRVRVTGPLASVQVTLNALPAVTPLKLGLVNLAAFARAKAAAATRRLENCILNGLIMIGLV